MVGLRLLCVQENPTDADAARWDVLGPPLRLVLVMRALAASTTRVSGLITSLTTGMVSSVA